MGIRINTRLSKNTSASFPVGWLLVGGLLALGAVCGVVQAVAAHPVKAMVVVGCWVLIGGGIWWFSAWASRKLDQRADRKQGGQ